MLRRPAIAIFTTTFGAAGFGNTAIILRMHRGRGDSKLTVNHHEYSDGHIIDDAISLSAVKALESLTVPP